MLKKEGVRAGVSDLFLAVPRGKWHGAFIEMKTESGVVSDAQSEFIVSALNQGYAIAVCRSFNSAISTISDYLKQ
ncbi:MAG: hypothetical protein E6R03_10390 [Hyphomicrobiaceae bacterium]|nr:MAG: hypothetical protein E6R03_10390 [Hyphomicrobiaceae bacterium]